MPTLTAGNSTTFTAYDGGTVSVASNAGFASVSITQVAGPAISESWGPGPFRKVFGPFKEGATVTVRSQSAEVNYDGAPIPADTSSLVSGAVSVLSSTGEPSDVLTGSTDPHQLANWEIPADFVGPHDTLLIHVRASNSGSANVKYLSLYLNSVEVAQLQNTTSTNMAALWALSNRGSLASQIGMRLNSAGIGSASGAFVTSTVNLSGGGKLSIRGWTLTSTAETLVLESHAVILVRGV